MLPDKLAFIDIETTGGSYFRDRIVEVGILRVENGEVIKTYKSLVNPETHIPEFIQSLNGITNGMVANAPTFAQIKDDILEMLEGCVFVAHNVRFDYGFIKTEFKRLEKTFSSPQLCTVRLSKALFPQYKRHNLDALIERYGFEVLARHRAFDDAKVLWDFYQIVQKAFPADHLEKITNYISKKITTPINIDQKIIDKLPEGPGVYIFYDEQGAVLYVGKSINIKERVLSHFRADSENPKELRISQQIGSIETITTKGELGALLKESQLIKELMPLHNRALRRVEKVNILRKIIKDNLDTVELLQIDKIDPSEVENILGVYKTKKAALQHLAEMAKEYSLCKRALGLETGKGFCFDYHLERCKGICGGAENPTIYNLRFGQAFVQEHLKPWPFNGPIVIKEEDPISGDGGNFIIDKWCFLGTIKYGHDYQESLTNDYNFDYDAYKILSRYLYTDKNRTNIAEINNLEELTPQIA